MNFTPVAVREAELSHPVAGIDAGPEYGSALVLARWYSEPLALVDVPLRDGQADAEQVARSLWPSVQRLAAARLAADGATRLARQTPALAGAGTAADTVPSTDPVPSPDTVPSTEAVPSTDADPAGCRPGHPAGRARRARAAVPGFPAEMLTSGLRLSWPPAYLLGRATVLRNAPAASVIVCTRDRADKLPACLAAVLVQEYPDFEVIVVDNAPADDAVADLVARLNAAGTRGVPLRRVVEPRPGLSWARNTGLAAASGAVVAYLDDDEHPDRHWLAELARGFALGQRVAGVSGLVLPAALETPAQRLYEEFGGHSKGRGFSHAVFDQASHARQHPLYPLPAFGVGASMAFDRAALTGIGGFDVALGAGTPAMAGEDTAAIADVMLAGGTFVYWPGAVMWHQHRQTLPEMEAQLNGYGSGLTAFYTRAVLRDPRRLATLARLAPRALRDLGGGDSVRTATMSADYPASLRRASRSGMLAGPARYLRSRRLQAKLKGELA
jgi:glycosyltransferase involved in cell wall biosynthesis